MATVAPVEVHDAPLPMTLKVTVYWPLSAVKAVACLPLVHALLEDDHVIWFVSGTRGGERGDRKAQQGIVGRVQRLHLAK